MNWILIHKYLSQQCSQAERERMKQWLDEDADHKLFIDSMRKIWDVMPAEEKKVDVKTAWNKFQIERMAPEEIYSVSAKNSHTGFRNCQQKMNIKWYQKTLVYTVAAAIILLVTVLMVIQTQFNGSVKISYQKVITAKGEKTSLRLSDGTHVMLNAESTLKIPSDYGQKRRILYLKGEAFFEVKHDAGKPFKVYAKKVYTEDIGTRFNIRAFPEDSTIEVVVADGKVALGDAIDAKQKRVFLGSHEQAVVSSTGKAVLHHLSDLSSYIGWTQDKLVFHDTPLAEVVKQLERWYGVTCIVKNRSLMRRELTATFQNESLSNVLLLIAKSMNIKAQLTKRTVVFRVK